MNCRVNRVKKNLRYRILTINGQTYILDMGSSLWKILFPLFYWIFPNAAYKVNDNKIVEKLKSPEIEQTKTQGESLLAGAVAILLANLLRPLADYFNIPSNTLTNTIIVIIVLLLVLSLYFYENIRSKNRLYQVINLEKFLKKRLLIRPQSNKHFFFILFSYLFFLGLTILFLGGFIQFANAMILFAGMVALFLSLFASVLTVTIGDHKVILEDNNKATS